MALYNQTMWQKLVHIRHILISMSHIMWFCVLGVDVF